MVRMNPFQLALLNISQRRLQRSQAAESYGPMAIDGLLSHGFAALRGDFLVITQPGRRALADFEKEIDRK